MKRIAATALALALSAASGSALANHEGNGYGDPRYNNDGYRDGYGHGDGYRRGTHYAIARVVSVDPIFDRRGRRDRRDDRYCRDDGYSHRYDGGYGYDNYNRASPRANGAALGAVIGGALGNQAGKGDGRKAATVAGAVIGGVIGAEVADNNQRRVQGDVRNDGYYGDNRDYRDDRIVRCRTSGYGYDGYYGGDDRYGYGDGYGRGYERRVIGYNVVYRLDGRNYRTRMDHHPGNTIRVRVDVRPDGRRIAMGY
jgi:uncharacterized protein YcfJ